MKIGNCSNTDVPFSFSSISFYSYPFSTPFRRNKQLNRD